VGDERASENWREVYADFSFEAFNSTYDALKGFDSFFRVLTGNFGIFCEAIRGCLDGSEFTLDVLLSGTKNFTIVLIRNLVREVKQSKKWKGEKEDNPCEWLLKNQKAIQAKFSICH
jgi:hypothetical protein